jgi:sulfur-carrier protein adenylyltransferase/sulfurtransferase
VQFLAGEGFREVYNLKGGIAAWQGFTTSGPMEMGMAYLSGDEKPADVVILAYGLESGLWLLYNKIILATPDAQVAGLLGRLVGVEDAHKRMLFSLYRKLDPAIHSREQFESLVFLKDVMEGGFRIEEFIEQNRSAFASRVDAVSTAMMLEAQALDLYMRYSQQSTDQSCKKIFYTISEQEKAHLASLAGLMEAGAS